jgi:uncharacterized protein YdaU (DUF1376 family)
MSRKSPAFSFYPDSWVLGTMAMTFEEQGVYLRMLCFQWANGPSDANAYANACGLAYQTHVERILLSKFVRIGDAWCNERLEQERLKQADRSLKAKTSAKQRWERQSGADESCDRNANAYANAIPNHMLSVSVSDSVSNTERESNSPTLEQVRAEVKAKGYTAIDPDQWWSFWDSVHWCNKNGTPVKWQSRLMNDNLTPKPAWKLAAEKAAKEAEKPVSVYKRG